jgi:hypothetical protein
MNKNTVFNPTLIQWVAVKEFAITKKLNKTIKTASKTKVKFVK